MATIQCPHCSRTLESPSALGNGQLECPMCQQLFPIPSYSTMVASSPNSKAADAFDPYYTWLGIPPHDQPPHHYRLLGLELFETNRDAIDNAANRQTIHLRSCSLGARWTFAQELLNQVAAARVCLLDATRKTEYDAKLHKQLQPTAEGKPPATYFDAPTRKVDREEAPPVCDAMSLPTAPPIEFVGSTNSPTGGGASHRSNPAFEIAKIIVGGAVGLAIGYLLLLVFLPTTLKRNGQLEKQKSTPGMRRLGLGDESTSRQRPRSNFGQQHSPTSLQTSSKSEDGLSRNSQADINRRSDLTSPQVETVLKSPIPSTVGVASGDAKFPKPYTDQDFPARVKLPNTEETNWVTILSLSEPLRRVELVAACDMTSTAPVISLTSAADSARWDFECEMTSEDLLPKVREKLAELRFDSTSGDIEFRWLSTNPAGAAALANSWLRLETSSKVADVSLRTPKLHPTIQLDLQKERAIGPLQMESIPQTDQLYLDLLSLAGLPGGPSFRNGMGQAKLDREVIIEFSDMPGAQIAVKLARIPQAPLGLIVEPRFKDGPAREYDLTFAQLEKTHRGVMEAIHEAKEKIPELSNNLSDAQAALQTAQGRTVSNPTEAVGKARDINLLAKRIQGFNRRLITMRQQEAAAQLRLNNVPKVLAFMRSLHGKEIPFRVVVKSSVAELALAEGMIGGAK